MILNLEDDEVGLLLSAVVTQKNVFSNLNNDEFLEIQQITSHYFNAPLDDIPNKNELMKMLDIIHDKLLTCK